MPVWPGDEPFSLRQERSDGILVSAFSCSCHAGTHVDAPLHLDPDGIAVDEIPLARLIGPAELIRVTPAEALMSPADLPSGWRPQCPRLLIRTDSSPLEEPIGDGFAGLAVELVAWLAEAGVDLIGVDTPSVDPFSSNGLAAHHALLAHDLTWIEGLWLASAEPGRYDLIALPLALTGAEAAPIRVLIRSKSVHS
jgi:arylformamidase